jgi:hypothetical protein
MKPLLLLEGLFEVASNDIHVHTAGRVRQSLSTVLGDWLHVDVLAHLHHFPPQPVNKSLPGGGSCLWNGHCPHGHSEQPGWLFNQSHNGTLSQSGEGSWGVGAGVLRFDVMNGHHGRLILMANESLQEPEPDASSEALLREAELMVAVLESLKGVIND